MNRPCPSSDAIVGGATENTQAYGPAKPFPLSFPFQGGSLAVLVLWAEFRLRHSLEDKNQTPYHNFGCEHTFWNLGPLCYHSVQPWAQDRTSELDGFTLVLR